jgi:hypothetical protein
MRSKQKKRWTKPVVSIKFSIGKTLGKTGGPLQDGISGSYRS